MKKFRKSPIAIACYVIAALLAGYFITIAISTITTINQYYQAYEMSAGFGETLGYLLQNGLAPLAAAISTFMAGYILEEVRKLNPANWKTDDEIAEAKEEKRMAKEAKVIAKGEAAKAKAEAAFEKAEELEDKFDEAVEKRKEEFSAVVAAVEEDTDEAAEAVEEASDADEEAAVEVKDAAEEISEITDAEQHIRMQADIAEIYSNK